MARTLRHVPPTSSVARLLDPDAAARAVARPAVIAEPLIPCTRSGPENSARLPRFIKRELALCPQTDALFEQLLQMLRSTTGTRLTASHTLRALLRAIGPHLRSIELEVTRIGALRLPSNSRGHESQRTAFEQRIAQAIIGGLQADQVNR
ncbi:MAG: hypothetical protein IT450_01425 [Phycisphaerales bacterium]|nr:hypothetical protein [Phycisphaerales bacterium]